MGYLEKKYLKTEIPYGEIDPNGGFIESPIGGCIGVEYSNESDTFRELCVNFSDFDLSNRKATNNFIRQIKSGNNWFTIDSYSRTVSDFSSGVSVDPSSFGKGISKDEMYELDNKGDKILVSQPWLYQLKKNVTPEAQFFIDTIVKNKFGIPIDMAAFIVNVILRKNNL